MIDAVFISDLHLNSAEPEIFNRFKRFIQWASQSTRAVYILGDFFHVWAGDDGIDSWSLAVAEQLTWLSKQGVSLYFIHGNRDFLLGADFANRASLQILPDPSVIVLNQERILLTHGDQYCTHDKGHQWLRKLTRNRVFTTLFMRVPYSLRSKWVSQVRARSEGNRSKPSWILDIVPNVMMAQMKNMQVTTVIHGHIHKPGLTVHPAMGQTLRQYVLSDWDSIPQILCYNKTNGFCFIPLMGD